MSDKESLLVNVGSTNQHHKVVEQLMEFVTSAGVGLQKAHVLKKRDEIIAGLS